MYISEQSIDLSKLHLQQEEVAQVKFFEISEFKNMVKFKNKRLTDTPILFEHLLEKLTLMKKSITSAYY